jgi:uncharacterized protein YecE (DUF72 family)
VSGWRYAGWRGPFYPKGLPQREELSYASQRLGAIEINGTFYSLQRPERFGAWYEQTPREFRFAVKGSRFITHMKRLGGGAAPLANFFASGVLRLDDKLGPILWQVPASFVFDAERIESFLACVPRDFAAAARLGRRHDRRLAARAWLRHRTNRPIRHALEVRHESFFCEELYAILRRHGVALVFSHTAGRWPYAEELTSDFVYLRLHGPSALYASNYDHRALARWARRVRDWRCGGRDVWVFFDNTDKRHAPGNAETLIARCARGPRPSSGRAARA